MLLLGLLPLGALLLPPAHAHGGSGLPGAPVLTQPPPASSAMPADLDAVFTRAAREFGVPKPLLLAIGYEASHWNPNAESTWGGWGMFDLREGDQDPSLEHAAALLELDPNRVAADWRENVRGAAAILADQARMANGGRLPALDDWPAWWPAVRAFSGRQEPNLQDGYASWVFRTVSQGLERRTGAVTVRIDPVDVPDWLFAEPPPPPTSPDTSLAYQYYAACSSNYTDDSRGSSDISMIVIHTVVGSYSSCYYWFADCDASASAHYVVRDSDGQITQMVKEADIAWHAGNWDYNVASVGIEHEGYVDDGDPPSDAMYRSSAALTADIAARQGVSLDRSHIIGHVEVPDPDGSGWGGSGHHTDPGDEWDWDYYMSLVTGSGGVSGGEILGVVADSDIYNGTRLTGVTVRIAETGETTTTDSSGVYRFEEVPFGTYTMHADADGYAEGTCTKTTSGETEWCSIALYPDGGGSGDNGGGSDNGGGTDNGGDNGGGTDSGGDNGGDSGTADTGPSGDNGGDAGGDDELGDEDRFPGQPVSAHELGGCSTVPGGPGLLGLLSVGLVPLLTRRRDRR